MPRKSKKKGLSIFISHSSVNLEIAKQVEAALAAGRFDVWLDDSDIRVGVLLGKKLLKAVEASRAVVLIWSEAAKNSAWVTTEILAAFHLNRFILSYTLDAKKCAHLNEWFLGMCVAVLRIKKKEPKNIDSVSSFR
jgi:thymidine phosphorylase